jgi:hypothetical protein
MLTRLTERLLPYSPEQLFDLAADVERYPRFLPWWIAARVKTREGNVYYTDQDLAFGPIRDLGRRRRYSGQRGSTSPHTIRRSGISNCLGPSSTFLT